jgi:gamma-glutamyl-gamma-aminobutyrate hydrolase PuuD
MKQVLAVCGSPHDWKPESSAPYEEALRAAGIDPVLISPGDKIPPNYYGLLLMGGTDVNPGRYGAVRESEAETSDNARDQLECELIQAALDRDLPVLAICRGLQILNVQHGGTLIQHLETTEHHRKHPTNAGEPAHQVQITPGTRLAEIEQPSLVLDVNSRHHQAIDRVGEGLIVSARDPEDGVVEAVERPDKRFVIGVQWHPENQALTDERQARLFQKFAAAL